LARHKVKFGDVNTLNYDHKILPTQGDQKRSDMSVMSVQLEHKIIPSAQVIG